MVRLATLLAMEAVSDQLRTRRLNTLLTESSRERIKTCSIELLKLDTVQQHFQFKAFLIKFKN